MSNELFTTDTSQWTLAIHRVTATEAQVWVGTLFPTLKMPDLAKVVLTLPDGTERVKEIRRQDWQRPFRYVRQRFYALCTFDDLPPASACEVRFYRWVKWVAGVLPPCWPDLPSGCFSTLATSLSDPGGQP